MNGPKIVRRDESPAASSTNTPIDLELLAEKVYQLMRADARLMRVRQGKIHIGR